MPAVEERSRVRVGRSGATTHVGPTLTNYDVGDLLIHFISGDSSTTTWALNAAAIANGWEQVVTGAQGSGTTGFRQFVVAKIATSTSEPVPQVTSSASEDSAWEAYALRNVDIPNIAALSTLYAFAAGSGSSVTYPTESGLDAGKSYYCLAVYAGARADVNYNPTAAPSSGGWSSWNLQTIGTTTSGQAIGSSTKTVTGVTSVTAGSQARVSSVQWITAIFVFPATADVPAFTPRNYRGLSPIASIYKGVQSLATLYRGSLNGPSLVEHSVFGATAPDWAQAISSYSDLDVNGWTGNNFYTYGAAETGWKMVGGRLWVPTGSVLIGKTAIFSYYIQGASSGTFISSDFNNPNDIVEWWTNNEVGTKTLVAGWNEVRLPTPVDLAWTKGVAIGWSVGGGPYYVASPNSAAYVARDGSHFALSEDGTGAEARRGQFGVPFGAANWAYQGAWYGTDIILGKAV